MADFDVGDSKVRSYWERRPDGSGGFLDGVPFSESPVDACFISENASPLRELIDSECHAPGGDPALGSPGRPPSNWNLQGEADIIFLERQIAAFLERGNTPSALPTAGFEKIVRPTETTIVYPKSQQFRIDRDDGLIQTLYGNQIQSIELSKSPNSKVGMSIEYLRTRSSEYDFATAITETTPMTASERPWIRGQFLGDWPTDLTRKIYVRVKSIASPNVTFSIKAGAAAAYHATLGDVTIAMSTATVETWVRLVDEAGINLGPEEDPVEMAYWQLAKMLALDEWSFEYHGITQWVPAAYEVQSISEVDCSLSVAGVDISPGTWTLRMERPKDAVLGKGIFAKRIKHNGSRSTILTFEDEYRDLAIRQLAQKGTVGLASVVLGSGANIGASTNKNQITIQTEGALVTGAANIGSTDYDNPISVSWKNNPAAATYKDSIVAIIHSISATLV